MVSASQPISVQRNEPAKLINTRHRFYLILRYCNIRLYKNKEHEGKFCLLSSLIRNEFITV